MARILIIYSTTDGHTQAICRRLRQTIEARAHDVALLAVEQWRQADLAAFDKIVVGASIRYGRHSRRVVDFVERNRALLDARPNAFFSVNIVARKPDKNRPDNNPYLRKFLGTIAWRPKQLAVFAGKLDYPAYRWFDRLTIRLIMWLTKGPTDPATVIDYTNWQQVTAFGERIAAM
jgi:menaquinone-dependent protoporphyrinogen oxidase